MKLLDCIKIPLLLSLIDQSLPHCFGSQDKLLSCLTEQTGAPPITSGPLNLSLVVIKPH